jgi:hypothetical protein
MVCDSLLHDATEWAVDRSDPGRALPDLQPAPIMTRYREPRAGIVVGFGAIATPDVPRAISMLRDCLD